MQSRKQILTHFFYWQNFLKNWKKKQIFAAKLDFSTKQFSHWWFILMPQIRVFDIYVSRLRLTYNNHNTNEKETRQDSMLSSIARDGAIINNNNQQNIFIFFLLRNNLHILHLKFLKKKEFLFFIHLSKTFCWNIQLYFFFKFNEIFHIWIFK